MAHYLLPIADREPLAWIVSQQRTAFPASRASDAEALSQHDEFFLYSTRGCFHNPTRDRGRVIGVASVTGSVRKLQRPIRFDGRDFPLGVKLKIELLAAQRDGVELAPLVKRLDAFPDPRTWSARMRRALVPISTRDAKFLRNKLSRIAPRYPGTLASYMR